MSRTSSTSADNLPDLAPLAWNGATLRVPEDWEPARLGKRYFYLEDGAGPVAECKWTDARKRLSPDAVLKRLARESNETMTPLAQKALRPAWARALSTRDHAAFSWESPHMAGLGAVFRAGENGPVIVLRFYRRARIPKDARAGVEALWDAVLDGFGFDENGGRPRFELYGIRLTAPLDRPLKAFSFKPGAFELEFDGGRESLTYARFAPAEAILRGKTLEEWTRAAFKLNTGDPVALLTPMTDETPALGFSSPGLANPLVRGVLRFGCAVSGRRRFTGGIVRHYREKNRILCLTARTTRPVDPERLLLLEKDYGTF